MSEATEAVFDSKEVEEFVQQLVKRLKKVKDGEKQYVGLLSAIVYRDIMEHFKQEVGPTGPWAEWSPSYRKALDRMGRSGNKKLQFTGKLRQTFTPQSFRTDKTKGVHWYNPAKTNSGFPYAYHHNEGALKPRPFMWLSDKALEDIHVQTLQFMLEKGI